ncbi:MAG: hypothetical protein M1820_005589 [Bogoriella megaspora]|nr:MAG: hypothetical protein M1820_005589 [Bogoriella megaspora]
MPSFQLLPHQTNTSIQKRAAQKESEEKATTRLHITPLDQSLLRAYLSENLLSQATNISYHSIQAFPEKSYGFVELPAMEAEKLKKKFNGSILKDTRVNIEEARPEKKQRKREQEIIEADASDKKKDKKSKKRKREEGVLQGVELEEGRKVKRGWTEPEETTKHKDKKRKLKDKEKESRKEKKREKSKYTDEPEVLFKAKVPSNRQEISDKDGEKKKKKKKKSKAEQTIVHEFSKTKKHKSSAAESSTKLDGDVSHFEEGVGWIDTDGEVVEPQPKKDKKRKKNKDTSEKLPSLDTKPTVNKAERSAEKPRPSSSGSVIPANLRSPGFQLRGELDRALAGAQYAERDDDKFNGEEPRDSVTSTDKEASPGGQSVSKVDEHDAGYMGTALSFDNTQIDQDTSTTKREHADNASPSGNTSVGQEITNSEVSENAPNQSEPNAISIDPTTLAGTSQDMPKPTTERTLSQPLPTPNTDTSPSPTKPKDVHPLEALYKRPGPSALSPNKKPTPIQTNFTFFGTDEAEAGDTIGDLPNVPNTPFTRQDLEFRGLRSAAPTPDTAAIGKRFSLPWAANQSESSEEDEGEGQEDVDMKDVDGEGGGKDVALGTGDVANGKAAGKQEKEESEFAKIFWESRGETNREWKKSRRVAMKEKRHQENRRLNRRVV